MRTTDLIEGFAKGMAPPEPHVSAVLSGVIQSQPELYSVIHFQDTYNFSIPDTRPADN